MPAPMTTRISTRIKARANTITGGSRTTGPTANALASEATIPPASPLAGISGPSAKYAAHVNTKGAAALLTMRFRLL